MERHIKLYNESDLETMKLALTSRESGMNRIEQIKNYAMQAGYKKLGIAHCISLIKYAEQLEEYLSGSFEVVRIDCKCLRIPSKMLVEGTRGISCNPAGQAKILEEADTELNISLGLCLGHDIVFADKSKAPTTTLIVKDIANNHNIIEGFKCL